MNTNQYRERPVVPEPPPAASPPSMPPPTVAQPGVLARSMRTFVHAVPIAVGTNVVAPLISQRPVGAIINQYIGASGYVPFSLGLAAGMNNDKLVAILLAMFLVINNYPDTLVTTATAALVGLALGGGLRTIILEHK